MTGCFADAKTPATITGQAQGNNEMVNTCAGRLRNRPEFASPPDSLSALPVLAPLVLRGAAPDTSVAAFQRPSQARPAYRARSAYLLGFIDLGQGGTRGAERKEQVGIHVATGGIVTPVAILGVPPPLEEALAWVTHRARHLSSSRAWAPRLSKCFAWLAACHYGGRPSESPASPTT
jgi:hypothetical protein